MNLQVLPQALKQEHLSAKLPGSGAYLKTFLQKECEIVAKGKVNIYATKTYAHFSKIMGNRAVDMSHCQRIEQSIKTDGYKFTILFVNEKMELIDGQHRF